MATLDSRHPGPTDDALAQQHPGEDTHTPDWHDPVQPEEPAEGPAEDLEDEDQSASPEGRYSEDEDDEETDEEELDFQSNGDHQDGGEASWEGLTEESLDDHTLLGDGPEQPPPKDSRSLFDKFFTHDDRCALRIMYALRRKGISTANIEHFLDLVVNEINNNKFDPCLSKTPRTLRRMVWRYGDPMGHLEPKVHRVPLTHLKADPHDPRLKGNKCWSAPTSEEVDLALQQPPLHIKDRLIMSEKNWMNDTALVPVYDFVHQFRDLLANTSIFWQWNVSRQGRNHYASR
jgi:hypothetical protein